MAASSIPECGGCHEKNGQVHSHGTCCAPTIALTSWRIDTLFCPFSTACATRSIVASSKCLPNTCTPIGNPFFVIPHGTEPPQIPPRLSPTHTLPSTPISTHP